MVAGGRSIDHSLGACAESKYSRHLAIGLLEPYKSSHIYYPELRLTWCGLMAESRGASRT